MSSLLTRSADPLADRAGLTRKTTTHELSQPSGGGHRFVISSEATDLEGDVVVQSGMELVSERIPAQVDHSGRMRDMIGHWRNVATDAAKRTTADLVLLDKGISRTADLVRSLLDAGVRMAASIGFVPVKTELIRSPDDDTGRVTGYRFLRSKLVEASVVVVPANPDALSLAKSLLSTADRLVLEQMLVDAPARTHQAPGAISRSRAAVGRTAMTTLAERIQAAEAANLAHRDSLTAAQERLADTPDDEGVQGEVETLLATISRSSRSLQLLRDSETALAAGAAPAGQEGAVARAASTAAAGGGSAAIVRRRPKASADLIVRAALMALEAHVKREPMDVLLQRRFPGDEGVSAVTRITVKAAQNPAMTNVPGWAAELVRDSFGAFMDLLQPASVVPRIPMGRFSFDGFQSVKIPMRNQQTTPNLAAAFRAEGAPIRVGAANTGVKTLTPKSLGIIGTFTNELFERSSPNIEELIRRWMIEDTAIMLDAYFLSNTAPIAGVSPGGIQNGIGAGNTRASTGKTVAQITADLQTMISAMAAANLLSNPVWVMNPVNASYLAFQTTASGTAAFPGISPKGGTLAGYPVVTSTTVPTNTVFLIDGDGLDFAGDAPQFLGTDVATIHEEGDPTLVAPISTAGTPNAVAAPIRSLYQTNSSALRAIWQIDWAVMRAGAVQVLTAVAWA